MVVVEPAEQTGHRSRPPAVRWIRPAGVLLLLSALAMAWFLWITFAQASMAWDGTRIGAAIYPQSEWRDGVVLHHPLGQTSPLHNRDRVVAIEGAPVTEWIAAHRGDHFEVGEHLSYGVIREGQPRTLQVTLRPYDWKNAVLKASPPLTIVLFLFIVAVGVVLARPRDSAARVLLAIAATAPFGFPDWPFRGQLLGLTRSPWPLWPQLVASCVWSLVWGSMIPHFALVFPKPPVTLRDRKWVLPTLYAAPLVIYAVYLAATLPRSANRLEAAERISAIWLVSQRYAPIAIIALMAWAYLRTRGTQDIHRVVLVVASLLTAFGVNLLGSSCLNDSGANRLSHQTYPPWSSSSCPSRWRWRSCGTSCSTSPSSSDGPCSPQAWAVRSPASTCCACCY